MPPSAISTESYSYGHKYKGVWAASKISHEQRIICGMPWLMGRWWKMRFLGLPAMTDLDLGYLERPWYDVLAQTPQIYTI